ncbi:hypothetical protein JN00_0094 [Metamycoplasma subdolum]|uniref:AAA+ superfamily ATPase n=1 Tax=Metamycoplasma subdolum TaxID=92407 RepID=A0A3M0A327_9BACT|nr:ATP-binding protein [Metamycoplasma subdolum]RMA79047.1 hypothetical protein JN00_0094 [Metamycoplasma subdolum]WPB50571.1 ATP-binding protein [Metamycoplasma subdolum]
MIKRDFYLNQLIEKRNSSKVKIITGIRRCGKSYLLSKLYKNYLLENGVKEDQIIIVEFDDEKWDSLLEKGKLRTYIEQAANDEKKQYYIFLDEIQLVENFVRAVNSLNKHENYDIYITGSNSKFLSKDINDEFKDRGTEINVRPLSFSEFYDAFEGDKRYALKTYLKFGGMPGLFEEKTELAKENYLDNLMKKVYIDDIKSNINTSLVSELSATVDALCSVTGNLTNALNMANYLATNRKISVNYQTIEKFFEGITNAFLFDQVKRYNIKGKEYLMTPSKFYCQDIGLRNVRINFREPNEGFLIENIVYNELKTRGYRVDVGFIEQRAKNKDDKMVYKQLEVDFIARISSKEYYIQIMDNKPEGSHLDNEYDALIKIPNSFKKIIVINHLFNSFYDENGILNISLEEFLLNKNSLDL